MFGFGNAYGFYREVLNLIYPYLKETKQSVRINNTYSNFIYYQVFHEIPYREPYCLISF